MTENKSRRITRFEIVGVIAALLAVFHIYVKKDGVDNSALILLGASALLFLLPELTGLISRIKKLKIGDFEAEFEKEISEFEAKVVKAEAQSSPRNVNLDQFPPPLHHTYVSEYNKIISAPSSNREKIILGAILAEQMIQETVKEFDLDKTGRLPARNAILLLQKEKFISEAEVQAFDEFWKIRNSVVHGKMDELSDRQTARVLDLLWRLVRIFG